METNRIYNMDCLEGMRALAGESVDEGKAPTLF